MKGCDSYQGFLSSRAIPSHDFAEKYLGKELHTRDSKKSKHQLLLDEFR